MRYVKASFMLVLFFRFENTYAQCSEIKAGAPPASSIAVRALQVRAMVGTPIRFEVIRTNITDHTISFWNEKRGSYVVEIFDEAGGLIADKRTFFRHGRLNLNHEKIRNHVRLTAGEQRELSEATTGSGVCIELRPGETFRYLIDVNAYYDMKPGKYTVILEFGDAESTVALRSDPIKVAVTER